MRRTAAVFAGAAALSAAFTLQAAAAPAQITAPNARAAAEVDSLGRLQRQKNVIDSYRPFTGVYCVIVDPSAGIDLPSALILANGGVGTDSVQILREPTQSCGNRRDAITVVPVKDGRQTDAEFTIAVL
ncbi:hypothetical protein ABZW30_45465 [Kitasatospora sp. NPDC004669]|uniref:hypothetical protein n=1 Tax=Kitasatospora sp. NPDC004669 TaxID=3154555 RepID=UPI0033B5A1C5